jgi:hypothetical protein
MDLPEPPEHYGLPGDSHVAISGDGQVVYRLLRNPQPSIKDFRSDEVAGRPRGLDEAWIEHAGVSVFDNLQAALAIAGRFPVHVAEVVLLLDTGCSIAKTRQRRHFTVWGQPQVLFGCVETVYLQKYADGAVERLS